jgi:hypothetical protein
MSEITQIREIMRALGMPRRHSANEQRDPIRAARFGVGARKRLAAVLGAMAVCGSVAVGAAPEAAARPLPGDGGGSCPAGYLQTSATESYAGTALPGGSNQGGAQPRDVGKQGPRGGRVQDQRNSSLVLLSGEIIGIGCMKHTGGKATMTFRWRSPGPLDVGLFKYYLIDCTSGESHLRHLSYETGTSRTSDKGEATIRVNPSRKYRMMIQGQGVYHRDPRTQFEGLIGHFGISPDSDSPEWQGETICA